MKRNVLLFLLCSILFSSCGGNSKLSKIKVDNPEIPGPLVERVQIKMDTYTVVGSTVGNNLCFVKVPLKFVALREIKRDIHIKKIEFTLYDKKGRQIKNSEPLGFEFAGQSGDIKAGSKEIILEVAAYQKPDAYKKIMSGKASIKCTFCDIYDNN